MTWEKKCTHSLFVNKSEIFLWHQSLKSVKIVPLYWTASATTFKNRDLELYLNLIFISVRIRGGGALWQVRRRDATVRWPPDPRYPLLRIRSAEQRDLCRSGRLAAARR